MKVILVQPYGRAGGHQSANTFQVATALLALGLDVTVVSRNGFEEGWETQLPISHIPVAQSTSVARVTRAIRHRKLVNHYELWQIFSYAFTLASNDPQTVVHVLDFEPMTLSTAYLRTKCPPCVLTLGTADLTLTTARGPWLKRAFLACGGLLLHGISKHMLLVCHSDRVLNLAIQRRLISLESRTWVIPSGTARQIGVKREDARHLLRLPLDGRVTVFFGPVRQEKGLDLLIDGLSRLPRGRLKLIVAGSFEHSPDFDPIAYAMEKGCAEDVLFIPRYVSRDEMNVIFGAADSVILPYRSTFQGQSDVLLTACEYSLPVLASDVGELGHRVRISNLGLLFQPDCPEAVETALNEFAAMPDSLLSQYRLCAEAYAASRPWNTVAEELQQLYVLACKPPSVHRLVPSSSTGGFGMPRSRSSREGR